MVLKTFVRESFQSQKEILPFFFFYPFIITWIFFFKAGWHTGTAERSWNFPLLHFRSLHLWVHFLFHLPQDPPLHYHIRISITSATSPQGQICFITSPLSYSAAFTSHLILFPADRFLSARECHLVDVGEEKLLWWEKAHMQILLRIETVH